MVEPVVLYDPPVPWIEVDEPFATPPRGAGVLAAPDGAGFVELADRWGSIEGARLHGTIDATACERLELRGSVLHGAAFATGDGLELDVRNCELVDCDLTTLRFRALTNTRLVGCKLSGCDLGSAQVRDVEFYDTTLIDVSFPDSTLHAVDVDRSHFQRVDLREATEVDLRSCSRLEGCLLSPDQIVELAFVLALASGASIERSHES